MRRLNALLRAVVVAATSTVALVLLGCASAPVAEDAESIREQEVLYQVRRLDGTFTVYRITVSFPGSPSGKTPLYIPREWASAKGADKGIANLTVLSPQSKLIANDHAALSKMVEHPPSALVTLSYDLIAIDSAPPRASASTQYLPILQPSYLHWIGYTTWVVPWSATAKKAKLVFENFAPEWKIATSFGNGRDLAFNWNPNTFAQSLVVAGDFRIVEKKIGESKNKLSFAIRGSWTRDDETFALRLAEIVASQRDFWRDAEKGDYLVTLLPIEKDRGSSMNGTALLNSFTSLVTQNNTPEDIEYVWVHESLHQWIARAFGGLEEPQAKLYWFSEGFTDYYTHVLMLRARQRSLNEFVEEVNSKLLKVSTSKHSGLNNDAVATGFHADPDIGQLAYQRGLLLAATWDNDIRAATKGEKSLDDAMRWMLAAQRKNPGTRLNRALIEAMAKQFGVADPTGDIDRIIELGKPIKVRVSALLPCVVDTNAAATSVQRFKIVEASACAAIY
ncbi:MAG TPA: hypothetical protein PK586_07765 [Casimicrobium sp.]|nr:hypothetical protein [Casimicrobium sp.]